MNIVKFVTAVAASLVLSGTAQAELISASADRQLCQAASRDGSLELAVEAMMDAGQFRYDMAPALLNLRCGKKQRYSPAQSATNYANFVPCTPYSAKMRQSNSKPLATS